MFYRRYISDEDKRERFTQLFENEEMFRILDREVLPFAETMKKLIAEHPEFEREIGIFDRQFSEIVTGEMEGMRDLLLQLKKEGFMLYGITNWSSKVYHIMEQYPIFQLLDGWVISSEEKLLKPEPEIYLCLCERFGLKPSECLFTDDKTENVEGARRVGMSGIVFANAIQYERELRKMLQQ
nr:HAD family phosphatase [Bacteroidaceae bacterium]